jgi:hypothetical protein
VRDPFGPDPEVEVVLPAIGVSFVPGPHVRIDDGPDDRVRVYPAVTRLQQMVTERRAPFCNCPRVVLTDGQVKVWHGPGCTEVLGEPLSAIL